MSQTLATLDIGSNSIHLLILRVEAGMHLRPLDRMKEMVRLGESVYREGKLTPEVMRRAFDCLSRMNRLARLKKADPLLAVATAAVREAANGGEFLNRLHEELHLPVRVITGGEEARLIYTAARRAASFGKKPLLFIDIGGGSVELTVGTRDKILASASLKLGVLRIKPLLGEKDPPSPKARRRFERHLRAQLAPLARAWRKFGVEGALLTAGTCEATDRLAYPDAPEGTLRPAAGVHRAAEEIVTLDAEARAELPGFDLKREDILVPGALLVGAIFRAFAIRKYQVSPWGLREGVALDWIERHRRALAAASEVDDLRRRSVLELSRFAGGLRPHSEQTAKLALALFDRLKGRHRLGAPARELLEYAALLHDIGHHIHSERHHRHTQYLILNSPLKGFTRDEIVRLSLIARHHRRSAPSDKDPDYAALPPALQREVRVCAALLRFADACDRSHNALVAGLSLRRRGRALAVAMRAREDVMLERWAAELAAPHLAGALGFSMVEVGGGKRR